MQQITSQTAFNNGENVHHRFSEIIKLKELLVKGSINFWSSGNSLGYPLLMTTQPFPTFSAAVFVLIWERFGFKLIVQFCVLFIKKLFQPQFLFLYVYLHKSLKKLTSQIFNKKTSVGLKACCHLFSIQQAAFLCTISKLLISDCVPFELKTV